MPSMTPLYPFINLPACPIKSSCTMQFSFFAAFQHTYRQKIFPYFVHFYFSAVEVLKKKTQKRRHS